MSDIPDHIRKLIDKAKKEGEATVNEKRLNGNGVEEPSAKIVRVDKGGSRTQKQKQTRFGKKVAM